MGFSDGWQDLSQHYQLAWNYTRAENGNVALTGEIDLAACGGEFTLALGFAFREKAPEKIPVGVVRSARAAAMLE